MTIYLTTPDGTQLKLPGIVYFESRRPHGSMQMHLYIEISLPFVEPVHAELRRIPPPFRHTGPEDCVSIPFTTFKVDAE